LYSRQLIWPSCWIGLEELPQNDLLNIKICPLDRGLEWNFFLSRLICTVYSWFYLPNVLGLRSYPGVTPQMVKFINWVRKFDGFYLSILRSFRGSVAFWRGSKKVRTPPGVIFGPYKLIWLCAGSTRIFLGSRIFKSHIVLAERNYLTLIPVSHPPALVLAQVQLHWCRRLGQEDRTEHDNLVLCT